MSELSLTPLSPGSLSLAADSAGSASLTGPRDVGDIPVWDGSGYDFLNYWYDVRSYGAVGDGTTDDTEAIQAALDAIETAGGGTLYIPEGTFRLSSTKSRSGIVWHLSAAADNLTVTGPGTLYTTVASAYIFFFGGALKASDNWDASANVYVDWGNGGPTVYAMAAAARGATSVTLTTAAQASNFAAGDKVQIRTGQMLDARTTEPDAEINEVVGADAGTGVLTLRYPLTKAYAQEYFISGTSGLTSTSVTANPAPFGVSNVTDRTSVNVTVDGVTLENTTGWHLITGVQIDGFTVKNVRAVGGPMMSAGVYRNGKILNNVNHFDGANNYGITTAHTTTDVLIEGNQLSNGQAVNQIHLHEGSARIVVRGNRLLNTASGADFNAISIRARAYDITVENNEIVNGGTVGIYCDPTTDGGGVIRHNRLRGNFGQAITVYGDGWSVYGNTTEDKEAATHYPAPHRSQTETLSGWVKFDAQTVTLGTLPLHSLVLRVVCIVRDYAFDSGGTDLVTVGYDGGGENYYATAMDVSTAFTRVEGTMTAAGGHNDASSRVAKAYYTNSGSEPTQGEALIVLEYTTVGARA